MKLLLCLSLTAFSAALPLSPLANASAAPAPPPASAGALTAPERAELLGRLEALRSKYPSMEARFSEHRTSHLLKKPISSSGSIAFQVPNKFRREVDGANLSLTVCNGHQLWIYYPNFKQVEEYTLGQRAGFDNIMAALTAGLNFANVENFYNLEAYREGNSYQLTLTPRKSGLRRSVQQLSVYLDGELNVRRTDLVLPEGDRIITTYSGERRGELPASTFDFTPPADANVTHPLGK